MRYNDRIGVEVYSAFCSFKKEKVDREFNHIKKAGWSEYVKTIDCFACARRLYKDLGGNCKELQFKESVI